MNPKNINENLGIRQQGQVSITLHNHNDECITFISQSHLEMHKIVHDPQMFHQKMKTINNQAKSKLDLGLYKEALSMLIDGQKILEYAAGSGKTIERDIIICVLHNLASSYHKLWKLDKCINYVEGLTFNLENHLTSLQSSVMSINEKHENELLLQSFDLKQMLSVYQIRFCALNSQINNHTQALNAAKKTVKSIKYILAYDEQYTKSLMKKQKEPQQLIELKSKLLQQILEYQSNLSTKKYKDILKAAHFSLQIWNRNKVTENKHYTNYLASYLKTYSIGDLIEFKPKMFSSKREEARSLEKEFQGSIYYKLIILAIGYFSISTQMRMLNNQSKICHTNDSQREFSPEYRQADIYHLLAIILISSFFPCDLLFLKHAINSYTTHFNTSLVDYKTVQTESLEKIIVLVSNEQKYKFNNICSTGIISQENLGYTEDNQYRLRGKEEEKKIKKKKKSVGKNKGYKNFSYLENKSVIKDEKYLSKLRNSRIYNDKQKQSKSKSKPKSKSKTHEKKSKQKNYVNIKPIGRSKKRIGEDLRTLSKKVSPKRMKEAHKQMVSDIHPKRKTHSSRKILAENKSPRRRTNVYQLHY